MPTFKLTKSQLDQLSVRPKAYIAYDDTLPGFGCRVTPNGVKSWIVEFREGVGGRRAAKRRITLGPLSIIAPVMARKQALDLLAQARLGQDVAGKRARKRAEPNLQELIGDYTRVEVALKKAGTSKNYSYLFGKHVLPELGKKRPSEITPADVRRLHRHIGETRPVTANRVIVLLSGLYKWAEGEGRIASGTNPVSKISKYPEKNRERFLSVEEISRLGAALREAETTGLPWDIDHGTPQSKHMPKEASRLTIFPAHAIAAIRLLLFTGCRLREILHLRWEEYDPERGFLFLADSKSGKKTVVLSEVSIALLNSLPRVGPFVIPGGMPGKPRADLKKPWAAVCNRANLQGLRIHDLRHTFASIGVARGMGLPIIGGLLGHTQASTTARYAHLDCDPLRRASEQISQHLSTALAG